jgi:hypothetical protein
MKRSNNTGGTSFHGVTLTTTPQQLIDALGEPQYFSNDGSDKTNMDYSLETEDEIAFTIYDWKEYRPLQMDETIEFHIGGFSYSQSVEAKNEVLRLINKK